MDLKEMWFELVLPSQEDGYTFGAGNEVSVDAEGGFDPGEDSWESEDTTNPRAGGTAFGREVLEGPTWGFALHVDRATVREAKDALGRIRSQWRASEVRDDPGAVTTLRYRIGNEYRRTYGRPRRFAAPPDNRILTGYVPITADFKCATPYTYDDVESVEALQLSATSAPSGFTFPITFPYASIPSTNTARSLVVGGDAAARPTFVFEGPLTNPSIAGPGWTLALKGSIPNGETVTVDLRPWAQSVRLSSGGNASHMIAPRTRLVDIVLEPGVHFLSFSAASTSGSGSCTVRWANTWNSF